MSDEFLPYPSNRAEHGEPLIPMITMHVPHEFTARKMIIEGFDNINYQVTAQPWLNIFAPLCHNVSSKKFVREFTKYMMADYAW